MLQIQELLWIQRQENIRSTGGVAWQSLGSYNIYRLSLRAVMIPGKILDAHYLD